MAFNNIFGCFLGATLVAFLGEERNAAVNFNEEYNENRILNGEK